MKMLVRVPLVFAALFAHNAFSASVEKVVLKELKADLKVISEGFTDTASRRLLHRFNAYKEHENNNGLDLVDYDEALFSFSAQIDIALQDGLFVTYCEDGFTFTICLPNSQLTTDELSFQIASGISFALNAYEQGNEGSSPTPEEIVNAVLYEPRINAKVIEIITRGDQFNIEYVFDPQLNMNYFAEILNMTTSIVSAANTAILSMARNIKG